MAPSEPLSPVERLFIEAGRSRISYGIWRAFTLPSLKINASVSSVLSGWPAEDLDDEETELKLARQWLEAEAWKRDAQEAKPVPNTADVSAVPLGPLMSTRQVREVREEEREAGRHITPEAFERALRRASRKARSNPELLPLSLGGQHADWWLVGTWPQERRPWGRPQAAQKGELTPAVVKETHCRPRCNGQPFINAVQHLSAHQGRRLLGYRSRSVLQRLVKAGHLRDYERGSQGRSLMLETAPPGLPTLQETVRSLTVARVGSPLTRPVGRDWNAIAEECNAMLNPSLWGPPPWSADRWAGLAGVLAIPVGADEHLAESARGGAHR